MKRCPQCNKSYPDSEQFCEQDGTQLVSAPGAGRATQRVEDVPRRPRSSSGGRQCPVCGGNAEPGETICNFCGTRLDAGGAEEPSASPPIETQDQPEEDYGRGGDGGGPGRSWYWLAAIIALIAGGGLAFYLTRGGMPPEGTASPGGLVSSPSPAASAEMSPSEAETPAATATEAPTAAMTEVPTPEATPPAAAPAPAHKPRPRPKATPSLQQRVIDQLHSEKRFSRIDAYTNNGTVTIFGKVFDDDAKLAAEHTARQVAGVTGVVDNLSTDTQDWATKASAINGALAAAGLDKVTAKVIGNDCYLSGEVSTDPDKTRAVTIAVGQGVQVRTNLIRVVPTGIF